MNQFEHYFYQSSLKEGNGNKKKTLQQWINDVYRSQKSWSKKEKKQLLFSKQELLSWTLSQSNFFELLKTWDKAAYVREYKPAIMRIDLDQEFKFGNIKLVPFYEANKTQVTSEKVRKSSHFSKKGPKDRRPVNQLTLRTKEFIKRWPSVSEAEKYFNVRHGDISDVCRGLRNRISSGGFAWEYVDVDQVKNLF